MWGSSAYCARASTELCISNYKLYSDIKALGTINPAGAPREHLCQSRTQQQQQQLLQIHEHFLKVFLFFLYWPVFSFENETNINAINKILPYYRMRLEISFLAPALL